MQFSILRKLYVEQRYINKGFVSRFYLRHHRFNKWWPVDEIQKCSEEA